MNLQWIVFGLIGLISGAFGAAVSSLLGDEVKGWLGKIPHALLWLAARRVPSSQRRQLHLDWEADLIAVLADKNDRPITRLLFGIGFSVSLIRGAKRVANELSGTATKELSATGTKPFAIHRIVDTLTPITDGTDGARRLPSGAAAAIYHDYGPGWQHVHPSLPIEILGAAPDEQTFLVSFNGFDLILDQVAGSWRVRRSTIRRGPIS